MSKSVQNNHLNTGLSIACTGGMVTQECISPSSRLATPYFLVKTVASTALIMILMVEKVLLYFKYWKIYVSL